MASSSMCGPSNPLQNLQKHTSTDRTLQQDRLSHGPLRNKSSALFRSNQASPSPVLESEFEQFSGLQPQLQHSQQSFSPIPFQAPFPTHQQQQHAFSSSPQLGGWASDFQRMSITSSPAGSLSRATGKAVQRQPSLNNWGQEFLQQSSSPASMMQQGYRSNYAPSPVYAGAGYSPMMQQQSFQPAAPVTTEAQFTDTDFERMFEEASMQMEDQIAAEETLAAQAQANAIVEAQAVELKAKQDAEQEFFEHRLSSDPRYAEEYDEPVVNQEPKEENGDDLARTAGQLLDTLSHNQTEKFQQSNFLALMRKLRDHEVKVEGNKMVENNAKDLGELPLGYHQKRINEYDDPLLQRSEEMRGDIDLGAFAQAEAHYDTCFGTKGAKGFGGGVSWEESF